MKRSVLFSVLCVLVCVIGLVGAVQPAVAGTTERVSVPSDGTQGNDYSDEPSISADGRFVAFWSYATNLVPGDMNGYSDIFVHDRQTGETTRVSVASDRTEGNGGSYRPSISADGRFVAFYSYASNLVPDDKGHDDVFVHDRQTGATTRVSVASDGTQANGHSHIPSVSADGRFVAFYSYASNLVPGDTNGTHDIFVHDRQTGETTRVSVASDGAQANSYSYVSAISADGRFVAFESYASNLVPADTNGGYDIFVHDRQTGQTTRVSVASDGAEGNQTSEQPSISAHGRFVAFRSSASNLVPGDMNGWLDVFVHDRQTGETTRVSVASDGTQGNNWSSSASISGDGRVVAFESHASNLVPGDTNGYKDVFVRDRGLILSVLSAPIIDVDVAGSRPGATPYSAGCDDPEVVNLTAPVNVTSGDLDYRFVRWVVDGTDQRPCERTVSITMDANHSAEAKYSLYADVTGDCRVTLLDFVAVRNRMYEYVTTDDNCRYDLTGDGLINVFDLIAVRNHMSTMCPE